MSLSDTGSTQFSKADEELLRAAAKRIVAKLGVTWKIPISEWEAISLLTEIWENGYFELAKTKRFPVQYLAVAGYRLWWRHKRGNGVDAIVEYTDDIPEIGIHDARLEELLETDEAAAFVRDAKRVLRGEPNPDKRAAKILDLLEETTGRPVEYKALILPLAYALAKGKPAPMKRYPAGVRETASLVAQLWKLRMRE